MTYQAAILEAVRGRERRREKERRRGTGQGVCMCVCVSHYQDESENRKGGSIKQDERKTTTVLLPVLEQGRKQQIF